LDTRTRILRAAATLLAKAPEADISTRAICDAAGIGAPVLYRQFGDKEGLLSAVVDFGFEQYLASKRAMKPTRDPVRDLLDGWDNHMAFARENPNFYRLMYSPGLSTPPAAAREAHSLLLGVLERCAAAGKLTTTPDRAAQMIMSANAGAALSVITRPTIYTDPKFIDQLRDAVVGSVLTDEARAALHRRATKASPNTAVAGTAATLAAQLRKTRPEILTAAERALLQQWLAALSER
jgi:AcrR family transcriptional regulator